MLMTNSAPLVAFSLALSFASAMPKNLLDRDSLPTAEVFDVLAKRIQGALQDHIPGCEIDPSYSTGESRYNDGEGLFITSACDNGLGALAVSRFHCWTDFYLVNWRAEYGNWKSTGQVIDCATTVSCNEIVVNFEQSCTTNTKSNDDGVQAKVEAKLPVLYGVETAVGFQYNHNFGSSTATQICTAVSNQGTCVWDDKKCHAIWRAQRNRRVFGYMRRSCDSPRDGTNMPNTSVREDSYFTVGMQDFDILVPDNQLIGCAAKCEDLTYPDEQPGGPAKLTPVTG